MVAIPSNGIYLEVDDRRASGDAIVLIMGLGASLVWWPDELLDRLHQRGFRVVTFDNRDIGLSSKLDHSHESPPSYDLTSLASDTLGLMDALNLSGAHLVGLSMWGMVAQLVAARCPERVLSLTSIMSASATPDIPLGNPGFEGSPYELDADASTDEIVEAQVTFWQRLASPHAPPDPAQLRDRVRRSVARSYHIPGFLRQAAACVASHDRRKEVASIRSPTLVMHGRDDPLTPRAAAYDLVERIEDAELRIVPRMGHDLQPTIVPLVADAIMSNASRASH